MWTKPTSWTLKDQLYVTPEGIVLRPIATIEEARRFNSIAVLDSDNVLHIAVGRDLAEYDVKHAGSLSAITTALCQVLGHRMAVGSVDITANYASFAPSATLLEANGANASLTDTTAAARVPTGRQWDPQFDSVPTRKAVFALLTTAICGSGTISYGTKKYGQTVGGALAGYTHVGSGMPYPWYAGLVTVHKYMFDCSFKTLINKIGDYVENSDEAEVAEKTAAAAAMLNGVLGSYADAQAFMFITHFTAAANQTAATSGVVKPVRAEFLNSPFGINGGVNPMMNHDFFGAFERTTDGTYATVSSSQIYQGDSAAHQIQPLALICKDGSRTTGGYELSIPAANHLKTQAQLNCQLAPYSGQTVIAMTRAVETLPIKSKIGQIATARVFGAICNAYVNVGTTNASSNNALSTTTEAELINWCFDYGGTSSVARTSGMTDEAYYAALSAASLNPMRQFPILSSLSHGLDVMSVIDMYRISLKGDPIDLAQFEPYIGLYGRRELEAYGVPITA